MGGMHSFNARMLFVMEETVSDRVVIVPDHHAVQDTGESLPAE